MVAASGEIFFYISDAKPEEASNSWNYKIYQTHLSYFMTTHTAGREMEATGIYQEQKGWLKHFCLPGYL